MSDESGYRARLRVRIGKAVTTDDTTLTVDFDGRPMTVRAAKQDQSLSEASWLGFGARGFATEARRNRLRRTAATTRPPPFSRRSARSRCAPSVHWHPNTTSLPTFRGFPSSRTTTTSGCPRLGSRRARDDGPKEFLRALKQAVSGTESDETGKAIHVLNLAKINYSLHAKVVLAVSSIEAMVTDGHGWSLSQVEIIEWAASRALREFEGRTRDGADAIRKMQH